MANLSDLEKQELLTVLQAAIRIRSSLEKNADSINDVIHNQVKVVAECKDEENTVVTFMTWLHECEEDLSIIMNNSEKLKQHFIDM